MIIYIGSDHAGVALKSLLCNKLKDQGHDVHDLGPADTQSVDYPHYAQKVAKSVLAMPNAIGVVICGSGIGVSISANRFKEIRCALCHDTVTARLARQHNNANMLALGARLLSFEQAQEILEVFLATEFEGGRHERRVLMIDNLGCCG